MTPVEASAAADTQRIYDYFSTRADLPPDQQALFQTARELVQTSNEQQGSGPTTFSLGLTEAGLRKALQWVSAEELGTPGTMATKTSAGQLSGVAARLSALKFGISGFNMNLSQDGIGFPQTQVAAIFRDPASLSQGDDANGQSESRLGGFINGSFGFGSQSPSEREDAFDYGNNNLTVGLDYRQTDRLVYGAAFGFTYYKADFNSAKSVADGRVESNAYTGFLYGLYNLDPISLDGIVSYGGNNFDIVRHIKYPSNNPGVEPVNETALGSTGSSQAAISIGGGYENHRRALTYSLNAHLNYMHLDVDGYTEQNAHQFDLRLQGQHVTSVITSIGADLSYAISERFGVLVPEMMAYWYHEFANGSRDIVATYVANPLPNNYLVAPTNAPTRNYASVGLGVSSAFQGGLQAFVHVQSLLGIEHIDSYLITAGARYEF